MTWQEGISTLEYWREHKKPPPGMTFAEIDQVHLSLMNVAACQTVPQEIRDELTARLGLPQNPATYSF